MINTSIHVRSCSSVKNHTRFQTKMGKVFSDQKGPKIPNPLGNTYLYGLYKEVPPASWPLSWLLETETTGLKMGEENSI